MPRKRLTEAQRTALARQDVLAYLYRHEDSFTTDELARRVDHTPYFVREALKHLRREGLVERVPPRLEFQVTMEARAAWTRLNSFSAFLWFHLAQRDPSRLVHDWDFLVVRLRCRSRARHQARRALQVAA